MPTDPGPSTWKLPVPGVDLPADHPDDLVAVGADLAPATLLAAYGRSLFPMPDGDTIGWWSPARRGVLPVRGMHVSRSLRRSLRRFEIRVDSAFTGVLDGCADPRRPHAWIDADMHAAYLRLHELGWAHSVEAWHGDELAGGVYGVAIGGLFAAESMFSAQTDGSKAALAGLVAVLDDEYAERRLVDTQWRTPHLASLGVVELPRAAYLDRLADALDLPLPATFD